MKSIPDENFDSYSVSLAELKSGKYKSIVNAINRNHDYNKFAIDINECNIVIWTLFLVSGSGPTGIMAGNKE